MAHIDMAEFLSENAGAIEPKYWILTDDAQGAAVFDPSTGDFEGTIADAGKLAPMQGFFVEAKAETDALTLRFTEDMLAVLPGTTLARSADTEGPAGLMILAETGDDAQSSALVRICADSEPGYEPAEDARLITDNSLAAPARVYTIGGNTALAVNSLPAIARTEIGVEAADTASTTLRFLGVDETLGLMLLTDPFPRMTWADAMRLYGSDKPDTRFGMEFVEIKDLTGGKGFAVLDDAEYVGAIVAPGCADYTRKQLDQLTDFVKRPQIGAKGMMWVKVEADGSIKSSVSKFYTEDELRAWADRCGAKAGDLILILAGPTMKTRKQLCELRLEMGSRLGLRDPQKFSCLWVIDFPLFEWDEETQRYYAMHHPFTSPNPEDIHLLDSDTGAVRATAYDMVVNGNELGGGSIRIHEAELQDKMFRLLGLTEEDAQYKFGFLMNAFKFGAPPHGGLAFGFDRFVSILAGLDSIRDVIAFPKNNSGRDMMIDAPSAIDESQLEELSIRIDLSDEKK